MATPQLSQRHRDVDSFLLWKWERVFTAFFDSDHSKQVDHSDFYLITRRVRDIYGAESKQMEYARKSLAALWDGFVRLADRNRDYKIEIDEWVNVLKRTDPNKQPKWFSDYCNYMFKLFDVSEDNKLDLAEYSDGMMTYGFKEADANEAFRKFAVDSKGRPKPSIDYNEFKRLWIEYFHSRDPNAPGNNLFGILKKERKYN